LIQTGFGLIAEQNLFQETNGMALTFEANLAPTYSNEGPYPRDIVTFDNTFYRTNYSGGLGAVQVWGHNLVNPPAPLFVNVAGKIFQNAFQAQRPDYAGVYTGAEAFLYPANTTIP
jgi:hypothetical protein